jgi:hypothetical protein
MWAIHVYFSKKLFLKPLCEIFQDGEARIGVWESDINPSGLLPSLHGRNTGYKEEVLQCLRQFPGLEDQTMVYDMNGKPYLGNPEKGCISLSHSHGRLAMIHSPSETGIDLELVGEKVINIRHKFMSAEELLEAGPEPAPAKLHVYWGVKESLYKFYGKRKLIFSENLIVSPFDLGKEGEVTGEIRIGQLFQSKKLHYRFMDQFVLVYIRNS